MQMHLNPYLKFHHIPKSQILLAQILNLKSHISELYIILNT